MTPAQTSSPAPRVHPRISANKLGEYLVSPPLRRRDIIERQKYPCSFIGAYYEPARSIIVDFLLGRTDREGMLRRTMGLVMAKHESRYAHHQAHGSAEAVLRFLDLEPRLDLRGLTPVHVPEHDKLDVEGVAISVYPDVVLEGRDARGRPRVGAIKLHFPKAHPHTETSAEYVATLLRMYAHERMGDRGRALEDACMVIDVFSGGLATAPSGHRRRWRDIGAACEEIRRAWPSA
ncbi:hypothetical protein [Paraliomyxa miuraensis]|uniref:hypothetical protein n=1 Tax=Paraliomyxa miuraensis TaxID=376150 RepID=UPI0022578901|nr:hypothetical protein [Paraliomyxa miuraensis]MCX4245280.1 hypothetical protein [Paraliomyxa miuraensis]